MSQIDEIVATFGIYFHRSGRLAVRNSNRGGRILTAGFYEDTPGIPSGVNRVTYDGLTVAESRRNRRRRREHMTATGAPRRTGRRWERHGVNEHARRVQQLSSGGRPCCRSGGCSCWKRESFPYLVKRRRRRHARARGKSMGGCFVARVARWRLNGGVAERLSKYRSCKFRSGKTKGSSRRQQGTIYRTQEKTIR